MAKIEVRVGDSSGLIKIYIAGESVLSADWSCNLYVVKSDDTSTHLIEKIGLLKEPLNGFFQGWLTSGETTTLGTGEFLLVYKVTNLLYDPYPFVKSYSDPLRVEFPLS